MAAPITTHIAHPQAEPSVTARPQLRLIHGGRSRPAMRRTYLWRRLVAGAVVLLALLGLVGLGRAGVRAVTPRGPSAAVPAPAGGSLTTVTARPGDTYWAIARRLQPQGEVRGLVDELVALNGGRSLQAGAQVRVPSG